MGHGAISHSTTATQLSFAIFARGRFELPQSKLKTRHQVRAEFLEAGISVSEWARAHNFKRETVVDVLRGQAKGLRGEAHRAAVALGLKAGRVVDVHQFKPAPPPARSTAQRRTRKAA